MALSKAEAVSYTHLDVYKRQVLAELLAVVEQRQALIQGEQRLGAARLDPTDHVGDLQGLLVILVPVSYTHLDVYKRQVMSLTKGLQEQPP